MGNYEITFTDIKNGQILGVSTNYLSKESFLEKLQNWLIENNWNKTKDAILCVNGEIEKLT